MHSKTVKPVALAIGLLVLVTGCKGQPSTPEMTETWTPLPPQLHVVRVTATPSVTPTLTLTPTPTPTRGPLAASEIFDLISGSVAFIETSLASGSGFLIEDGYLVTNAHVVWPFDKIRAVFPDGTEFEDVPVVGWDLMADLAVAGPIETDLPMLAMVDGEDQIIGADVYLVGYPGEVETFPKATITRGLISRMRESELLGISFFQSDALVAGGQSGGVLVSEKGDVIGVSGYKFTEAGFALVASAIDLLPRVEGLILGEDVDRLGRSRSFQLDGGKLHHVTGLEHDWDEDIYVMNEPAGTEVEIALDGRADGGFVLISPFGDYALYADDSYRGDETGKVKLAVGAPHFLVVFQSSDTLGVYQLITSHPIAQYVDMDDGRSLHWGQTQRGSIDFPGDADYFKFSLRAGDVVNIRVESIMIDPVVAVGQKGDQSEQFVYDDDSGGGLFGTDAELSYQVLDTMPFYITVSAAYADSFGGYALTVDIPGEDAPTPMAPEPTPAPIDSEFGPMALYESEYMDFAIRYPADWTDEDSAGFLAALCRVATACFYGEDTGLVIAEEDLQDFGLTGLDLKFYTDMALSTVNEEVVTIVSRETRWTAQGIPAEVVVMESEELSFRIVQFITLSEGIAFKVSLFFQNLDDPIPPWVEYVLDSFEITE